MGAGPYTKELPNGPGWWWMKILEQEEPVEVEKGGDGQLYVKVGKTPVQEVEGVQWSMFPISKPSRWSTSRVRIILGDKTIEMQIMDEELLQAKFPGLIMERHLAEMMVRIFQEEVEPTQKASRQAMEELASLRAFLGQRRPDMMYEFLASRKPT